MPVHKLFGTSGIRGDEEKLFTNEFCFRLGVAFDLFLKQQQQSGPVIIGMDPRGSSPRLLKQVSLGLAHSGREVYQAGACPVPAINYALLAGPYAGGVMVTGSHIVSGLNGVKFFARQEEFTKEDESLFTGIFSQVARQSIVPAGETRRSGCLREGDQAISAYEEMLVGLAREYPSWKVVVDPGNGAQSGVAARVLSRVGCRLVTINDDLQAGFISRDTETEGVVAGLQKKVAAERADLGVAFDADGDRVVFVDEKGGFIRGDYSGAILAKYWPTPAVCVPVNVSQVVDHIDKKVIRTKVGSPYVIEAMKKNQAGFGFEANGGGIWADVMLSRDGGTTMMRLLNLLAERQKSLSQLIAELPKYYSQRFKIDCPMSRYSTILATVGDQLAGQKIDQTDGLKIWVDRTSWLLFRPSGNAAEFRVFAESDRPEKAESLVTQGRQLVERLLTG